MRQRQSPGRTSTKQLTLAELLTDESLRKLADSGSYERGAAYFRNGNVTSILEYRGRITASVAGSDVYSVTIGVKDNALRFSCDCPYSEEVDVCKHCVATSLEWLKKPSGGRTRRGDSGEVTLKDVESFLGKKKKEQLVAMVMEQVTSDESLRRELMLQVASTSAKGKGIDAYRRAIEQATRTGGYIEYRQVRTFVQGINQVVGSMREMLDDRPDDLIELCEFAITRVEQALQSVDDSGGYLGGQLEELGDLHLQACRKGKPEPTALASRLFRYATESEWETFHGAYTGYAKVLGREGRRHFRELAEWKWATLPKLGPGEKRVHGERFRITSIMKELAHESKDIDRLVEIESHDLSYPYAFLTIATIYRDAGRFDEALDWAEKGMAAFSGENQWDSRLVEFLIDEYSRRGARDKLMALAWAEFQRMTTIDGYRNLKKRVGRNWRQWRPRAIEHVRDILRNTRVNVAGSKWLHARPDNSLLVQIYLEEKDIDAAWQSAVEGGCNEGIWMILAESREKSHPDDALTIYKRNVDKLADAGDYQGATNLLLRIRPLMKRSTAEADFPEYLAELRAENKRRRNFMALLDKGFRR